MQYLTTTSDREDAEQIYTSVYLTLMKVKRL
jgi:hypothetical protein